MQEMRQEPTPSRATRDAAAQKPPPPGQQDLWLTPLLALLGCDGLFPSHFLLCTQHRDSDRGSVRAEFPVVEIRQKKRWPRPKRPRRRKERNRPHVCNPYLTPKAKQVPAGYRARGNV